ncbi:class I SAM-dependent methyltransferase [Candidatus Woesebacteria bacterium]|nr:class I SAM-dependent methyltransferase [Candidatus Woesebacteria bacterium]
MKVSNHYNNYPVIGRFRTCLELVLKQKPKGKTLVDVGSSNGLLIAKLSSSGIANFIGIDSNKVAINFARENINGAEFFVSSADDLPVKSDSVDIVTMFDVIEHLRVGGEVMALKEIGRILKQNGTLLLSTPNNNLLMNTLDPAWYVGHRHYGINNLKEMIEKSGFRVSKAEIRGGLWFSIYLIWLYFSKHMLGVNVPRNIFLERKDDEQFNKKGIHTIYIVAKKV